MHEVLVNVLGGLSLPRKSVVRLTDRPKMTLDVYRGRKTTKQQQNCRQHCKRYIAVYCYSLTLYIQTSQVGLELAEKSARVTELEDFLSLRDKEMKQLQEKLKEVVRVMLVLFL